MQIVILANVQAESLGTFSGNECPWQFIKLKNKDMSLFQLTYERAMRLTAPEDIYISVGEEYQHFVVGQVRELNETPNIDNILLNDAGKAGNCLSSVTPAVIDKLGNNEKDVLLMPICHMASDESMGNSEDKRAGADIVTRPWGYYIVLEEKPASYKIKKITVLPGKRISRQLHYRRSEHWVIVSGVAKVSIEHESKLLVSGESTFVMVGQIHCLENPGDIDLEVIEVQLGDYLEEDDIVRMDGEYSL